MPAVQELGFKADNFTFSSVLPTDALCRNRVPWSTVESAVFVGVEGLKRLEAVAGRVSACWYWSKKLWRQPVSRDLVGPYPPSSASIPHLNMLLFCLPADSWDVLNQAKNENSKRKNVCSTRCGRSAQRYQETNPLLSWCQCLPCTQCWEFWFWSHRYNFFSCLNP